MRKFLSLIHLPISIKTGALSYYKPFKKTDFRRFIWEFSGGMILPYYVLVFVC